MLHTTSHPLAGKTVKIKPDVEHPQVPNFGGSNFIIEDWADILFGGKSWMFMEGHPASLIYALRTGFSKVPIPTDDEVLYGKVNGLGHLLHITELEI
jgi:hypothetical protein